MSEKKFLLEEIINSYLLGDCLEIMTLIPDDIFELIIIDPPNLILAKHFATRKFFRRTFGDLGLVEGFYKKFFEEFERVLKNTGLFYIFCTESSYPFFWYYCYSFTKKIRLITWDKIQSINGYHWRHQTEQILFGLMPEAPKVKTGDGDIIKCRAVPIDERDHPAQKPEELISKLILKSSKPNDIVADFFAGNATILKVAKKLGRLFFGTEYDNDYYETSKSELDLIPFTTENPKIPKSIDNFL